MASINQANHLFVWGDVKIDDLGTKPRCYRYPHDLVKIPRFGLGEKIAVVVSKAIQEADPKSVNLLLKEIETATLICGVGEKTIKNVARRMGESMLENLNRLQGIPALSSLGQVLRGIPAFVIAAGPSLDKNIHLLKECSKYGVIIAMNTSARPLRMAGVPIDMLVTIESLDSTATIEAGYGDENGYNVMALDVTAAPTSWTLNGCRRTVFVNDDLAFSSPFIQMGGAPIPFGGCVATAAVSIARFFGASGIYLLGQDLAWTDFRGYAKNTLSENLTCELVGSDLMFHGTPRREGQILTWVKVPDWSGKGEVYTTYDMISFIQWFQTVNKRRTPGSRGVINCTEGGAMIPNVPGVPLETILANEFRRLEYPTRPRHVIEDAIDRAPAIRMEQIQQIKREMARKCRVVEHCAGAYLERFSPERYLAWRFAVDSLPVIDAFIAGEANEIRNNMEMNFEKQIEGVVSLSADGARDMIEMLERG